jgi:signal peptidase I
MNSNPPPMTPPIRKTSLDTRSKILVAVTLVCTFLFGALIVLRLLGLVRPFYVPTRGMSPAVLANDHVLMENLTFKSRQPHRGDIVVFKADGLAMLKPATLYLMRVAGEPGEHLRLADGKIFINDQLVTLSNAAGPIRYDTLPGWEKFSLVTNVTIPPGNFFLLGDNSTNSLDSRFYGCVPRENIQGRVSFCYWPPSQIGAIK